MVDQFFGQFLLQKGLLTAEQLSCALQDENAVRVKLGVLAIDKGWLTAEEAQEIYNLQMTLDKRFGEIAVTKGYLGELQVEELLQTQHQRHLSLSQAILNRGYLDLSELTSALELFKRESALDEGNYKVDSSRFSRLLLVFPGVAEDQKNLYYSYVELFLRSVIRFLQVNPVLKHAKKFEAEKSDWIISQIMQIGGRNLVTGLILPEKELIALAGLYSKEVISAVDELALDAAAEFLNLQNGLFSINLSNAGTEVQMLPQQAGKQSGNLPVKLGYSIPIIVPFGEIQLVVAELDQ